MSGPIIVANTFREASRIAHEEGLHGQRDWYFGRAEAFHGRRDVDILIAECWDEQPHERVQRVEIGGRTLYRRRLDYPVTEGIQTLVALGSARVKWVLCA